MEQKFSSLYLFSSQDLWSHMSSGLSHPKNNFCPQKQLNKMHSNMSGRGPILAVIMCRDINLSSSRVSEATMGHQQ